MIIIRLVVEIGRFFLVYMIMFLGRCVKCKVLIDFLVFLKYLVKMLFICCNC